MAQQRLLEQLKSLAEALAQSLGLGLWGLEISSGPRMVLRVYLEKDKAASPALQKDRASAPGTAPVSDAPLEEPALTAQGVSVDECASFSRLFGLALDVEDIMPGAYVLEVSSPGFERLFFTASQLAGAVGRLVDISFFEAPPGREGRKKFRGLLAAGPLPEKDIPDDARFALRLENEESVSGEDLVFAFSDVKKARQVWIVPEKVRPGKGGKTARHQKTGSGILSTARAEEP